MAFPPRWSALPQRHGDGTAALTIAITPDRGHGHQRDRLVGQCPADRWPDLDGQRHTITFKSGSAPAGTALPAGSGVLGNIVTDGNGNSSVYLGTTGTPTGTVGDLLTAIDLASGVQKAVINTTTGVAAFSNASGTNAAIAGGIVTLTTGTGADLSITGEADLLECPEN